MATSALPSPCMDRLDAARALLGVSPAVSTKETSVNIVSEESQTSTTTGSSTMTTASTTTEAWDDSSLHQLDSNNDNNTGGAALDALAALASSAVANDAGTVFHSVVSLSSDDDSEAMPPPPPRRGRVRSVSNPEGMEKWDSLYQNDSYSWSRRHFVLPSSILEEELAEANAACEEASDDVVMSDRHHLPLKKRYNNKAGEQDCLGTSPNSVASPITTAGTEATEEEEEVALSPVVDEADMDPAELLRRARSRLLEDLSEGSLNGEKGVLTLPHSLNKYKEVYNKNGRIGIYTPAERAAIIARFNGKRSRRVWNKKIRYNCRKSLADRRMRVKGRFVKRSTEALAKTSSSPPPVTTLLVVAEQKEVKDDVVVPTTATTTTTQDQDMPDVNDPEAGFAPTKDQPYRRLRRHTIT